MKLFRRLVVSAAFFSPLLAGAVEQSQSNSTQVFDVIIKGGTVYDGSGGEGRVTDVAMEGDRIAAIGIFEISQGRRLLGAHGLGVAPGFLNKLRWFAGPL